MVTAAKRLPEIRDAFCLVANVKFTVRCGFLSVSSAQCWARVLTTQFFAPFPVYMLLGDFRGIGFQTIVVCRLPASLLLLGMTSVKKAGHR